MIDGSEVGFRANALTPRLYRHRIGRDIIRDINTLRGAFLKAQNARKITLPEQPTAEEIDEYNKAMQEAELSAIDLEIFENIAFVMAKQYDNNIPNTADEWLETFGMFSIYAVLPEILELWTMNEHMTAIPKKK